MYTSCSCSILSWLFLEIPHPPPLMSKSLAALQQESWCWIPDQAPLGTSPSTEPLTLPSGQEPSAVFAVSGVESNLSSFWH